MNTPILDFLSEYRSKGAYRFHMPGHKGIGSSLCEELDITEIDGADSLFEASGIIAESEKNASSLFEANTFYSTEGSSLCIRAMLYLVTLYARENGKRPLILAGRNAHKSFLSAASLIDFDIEWIYPMEEESYLSCKVSSESLDKLLSDSEEKPTALYLTSPDYLGNMQDIEAISAVCHKHGVLLLVDNAHGAYLKFLSPSSHPIDLGADMCCDSAHKTLHALTGSAYLHVSHNSDRFFVEKAKLAMALFASTSPSYLILASVDKLNAYLASEYRERLSEFLQSVNACKEKLTRLGYKLLGNEPLKLTVRAKSYGYYGNELAQYLIKNNLYPEFYDKDFLVLMLSEENDKASLDKLVELLSMLPKKKSIDEPSPKFSRPECKASPRSAALSPFEKLNVKDAHGRVLALSSVSCPPAVPILVPGEIIDQNAVDCFEYYGIHECLVIKKY